MNPNRNASRKLPGDGSKEASMEDLNNLLIKHRLCQPNSSLASETGR